MFIAGSLWGTAIAQEGIDTGHQRAVLIIIVLSGGNGLFSVAIHLEGFRQIVGGHLLGFANGKGYDMLHLDAPIRLYVFLNHSSTHACRRTCLLGYSKSDVGHHRGVGFRLLWQFVVYTSCHQEDD